MNNISKMYTRYYQCKHVCCNMMLRHIITKYLLRDRKVENKLQEKNITQNKKKYEICWAQVTSKTQL